MERSYYHRSKDNNWHENLEIQICNEGCGTVLLNGEKHAFHKHDVIVVNSNVLHYTETDTNMIYSCLIVSTDFCKRMQLDPNFVCFEPLIKSPVLVGLFEDLVNTYSDVRSPSRVAKLNKIVLEILIELTEHHTVREKPSAYGTKKFEIVKNTLSYIRENYARRLTIDEISDAVLYDKYALCREFKRLTGQTMIENLNNYRCIKAAELLSDGYTVAEAAASCGFENLSYFAKAFKKHIGKLPSEYKG